MNDYLIRHKDQITIELCKRSFWHFCKNQAPDFYKDERTYLKELCNTLQSLYEGKLLQEDGTPYKKLVIQLPPRHGKSRTLTNFSAWILGKNVKNKLITGSYNDDLAQDFSRFTRDIISQERAKEKDIIYCDIFPETRIKHGDSSYKKWALEGQFFNYKGTGIGGSITGRGSNILITDDPIKDAETAYNDTALKKIWLWYVGTFLSRVEEGGIQIICMTPWCKKDLVSRILEKENDWYIISMPVYDGNKMLCPELFSYDTFIERKDISDEAIFSANYMMKRIDIEGLLYGTNFKTYTDLPKDEDGKELTSANRMWADTADKGSDYLCAIFGRKYKGYTYITDVYYTKDSVETTEPELAFRIIDHKATHARIEGNAGGHAIGNHIKRILEDKYKWYGTIFDYFTQTKNKESRILSNAAQVKEKIIFPVDWKQRWPDFYRDVTTFMKEGKNANDDAPDTLTQIVECDIIGGGNYFF